MHVPPWIPDTISVNLSGPGAPTYRDGQAETFGKTFQKEAQSISPSLCMTSRLILSVTAADGTLHTRPSYFTTETQERRQEEKET